MALHIIILAAGRGQRMYSNKPKVLRQLAGKPLLEWVINAAQMLYPEVIHVVHGADSQQIMECFKHYPVNWILQEEPLGTGHAVMQVLPQLPPGSDVLILCGDVPLITSQTLERLVASAHLKSALALLCANIPHPDGFGRILRDNHGLIRAIVEDKDASTLELQISEVYSGICCLSTATLTQLFANLNRNNSQQEYYLTDIVRIAVNENLAVESITPLASYEILGVNSPAQLESLERTWQAQLAQKLLHTGVTLADAKRLDIRGNLTCGRDVFIDVNCVFIGNVVLADGCQIAPNCILKDAIIGANSQILANSVVEDCEIGEYCKVGPFARLRPNTYLDHRCTIGNFVEMKNAIVGSGFKANHLAYIGDSYIGKMVTIGAGVITCNYDGAAKRHTVIGDAVFIGSDTQLIAPITVGKNATIGAGSTIRQDVPADALTLTTVKQKTIYGWQRPIKQPKIELQLPKFSDIDPEKFVQELDELLQFNLKTIENLLQQATFDWNNLMLVMENLDDSVERLWAPFKHLHAVMDSKIIRKYYRECLPKLSEYEAKIGQNERLYQAIKSIQDNALNITQQKIINDTLRNFTLSGVALPAEKKLRFKEIQARLSELANQFETNVLDAQQAFTQHVTDPILLLGLPEHILHYAHEMACKRNLTGWLLTLEAPCYLAIIKYAENRSLREQFYAAYVTLGSDQGPHTERHDNSIVIDETLALRQEKAQLLGYANYSELSLVTKMAASTTDVMLFLDDLVDRVYDQARQEFTELQRFALQELHLHDLHPWDIAFISEKMRLSEFNLSQEELRQYFPLDTLINGLFVIVKRLYGMQFVELTGVNIWSSEVKCYQVIDDLGRFRGILYADLFARPHKRDGAWMDALQGRRLTAKGEVQFPIATLTCNFAKPTAGAVPTFTHDEVLTLFHEWGHCLQHLLTKVDYLSASGINAVEWDAVELPSQFFENWCWDQDALQLLTRNVKTNEPLPATLYQQLLAVKNFQAAMTMLRQLGLALFDFRLHLEYRNHPDFITKLLCTVREATSVIPIAEYNRFQNSFSHIFAGGYASAYYSYLWAEVLSSDAFARFEEDGIFNAHVGRQFLHTILELGGSRQASEVFTAFRGRKATLDAFLRHNGIKYSGKL